MRSVLVSETFESNGSTSQASICASTMSLMAAGVPISKPVAGISCGLVTGATDDDYIVLTDIQGLEEVLRTLIHGSGLTLAIRN